MKTKTWATISLIVSDKVIAKVSWQFRCFSYLSKSYKIIKFQMITSCLHMNYHTFCHLLLCKVCICFVGFWRHLALRAWSRQSCHLKVTTPYLSYVFVFTEHLSYDAFRVAIAFNLLWQRHSLMCLLLFASHDLMRRTTFYVQPYAVPSVQQSCENLRLYHCKVTLRYLKFKGRV